MGAWISYFDSDHSIYVNDRHRDVHNALIASDIRAYVPGPDAVVLDYGCGDALHADHVAAAAGRLILSDAGPRLLETLAARFADNSKIEVRSAEALAGLPDASVDLIVMHSVAQYLNDAELDSVLATFRRLVRPGGTVLIGDIIHPDVTMIRETAMLLRFAAANGFLPAALGGLVRTALSGYPKLRARLGLSRHHPDAMLARLARAGFTATRAPRNIGHDQSRMTFRATVPPA
ncbi:MAG TPA: class I SAM-dependent methyltransferase [Xanthobacteraceae bacterium]|nr:class I SAM-dependent methyltransferase [Xanthobacteraceae bacterium]